MHIAVFYQYYHNPDCAGSGRHYAFLRAWAPRHTVTLITSDAGERRRLTHRFDWIPEGVHLLSLRVPYDNRMGARARAVAFARYAVQAMGRGLRLPRPDVVLGSSTPLSAAWAAARVARWHGVPWVFEVRDLWPDFPIQMGAVRSAWLQRRLYALEHRLYTSAAHLVPLSPDMAAHLRACGVPPEKITLLPNGTDLPLFDSWTDAAVEALRQEHGLAGRRVVLYGGAFGRANDLPTLLSAARRLASRDDLRFVFIGDGYHTDDVAAAARQYPHIVHLPPQPHHRMPGWFRLADVSVVSFLGLPVLAANAPAKFYDSLAAGTPVIVTNPGWTKAFVETHGCGWYSPPSDAAALAHTIEAALADPHGLADAGQRAQAVARAQFDRAVLARRFEAVLQQVAERGAPRP